MNPASIQDLSVDVRPGLPVWPGDPAVTVEVQSHLDRGDSATVHRVAFSTHTGTHVDAPAHFIRGAASLGEVPWEGLVGRGRLVDVGPAAVITAEVLDRVVGRPNAPILLLRTVNSHRDLWGRSTFARDYVALDQTAAAWLVSHGVKGIGIDYLSIEPFGAGAKGHPVHLALLAARVAIIEGLDLRRATPGSGWFACLPLRLGDLEGAPARAIWMPDPGSD
jgi:arylformamidase